MPTLTPAQIAAYAKAAGFTAAQVPIMTAIALAESGGQTDVTNTNRDGSVDHGVWQINTSNDYALALGDWRDPAINARMAYAVFKRQGYHAWSVFNSQKYRDHLGAAMTGATTPVDVSAPAGIPNPIDGLKVLSDPHTYLRLAMFFGGTTLLGVGLVMMGWGAAPDSVKKLAIQAAKTKAKMPKATTAPGGAANVKG